MILNTRIWSQTIEAAKLAASTSPAWLRAIERADIEIRKARYWSYADGVLTIQSTTSKKLYGVDDKHTCDACAHGHRQCKYRAARRLMIRYTERLQAAPIAKAADDRANLITDIKTAWTRKHPHTSLGDALMARFGVNNPAMLNTEFLRRVQVALNA